MDDNKKSTPASGNSTPLQPENSTNGKKQWEDPQLMIEDVNITGGGVFMPNVNGDDPRYVS